MVREGECFDEISPEEAEILLKKDVLSAETVVSRVEGLSQGQVDALVSLVYNIGVNAFEKSTLC
ncbi:MAG: glycoside hydrolase family protein, partial [Rickettsiales bacterium]|nr:glycoside hydrolase family protein [Rickettsiales bacterium]